MEHKMKLSKVTDGEVIDAGAYRSLIESLRYLVNTRPDLAYSVGVLSRFMESPEKQHWTALKQVLRYVQGTTGLGCVFRSGRGLEIITGYSDSDMAGELDDRKITSGQVFLLGSSAVTWASQKQKTVALSSCEVEYIAASAASCQAVWLSRLLGEMIGEEPKTVELLIDNLSAIGLQKSCAS
jgi:hypothetical protein